MTEGNGMTRKHRKPEQIAAKLGQVEMMEVTRYRWSAKASSWPCVLNRLGPRHTANSG